MMDMAALQEAEGRWKAAREALAQAEVRAKEAIAVAEASVQNAREQAGRAAEHLDALYEAQAAAIKARRERTFGTGQTDPLPDPEPDPVRVYNNGAGYHVPADIVEGQPA